MGSTPLQSMCGKLFFEASGETSKFRLCLNAFPGPQLPVIKLAGYWNCSFGVKPTFGVKFPITPKVVDESKIIDFNVLVGRGGSIQLFTVPAPYFQEDSFSADVIGGYSLCHSDELNGMCIYYCFKMILDDTLMHYREDMDLSDIEKRSMVPLPEYRRFQ